MAFLLRAVGFGARAATEAAEVARSGARVTEEVATLERSSATAAREIEATASGVRSSEEAAAAERAATRGAETERAKIQANAANRGNTLRGAGIGGAAVVGAGGTVYLGSRGIDKVDQGARDIVQGARDDVKELSHAVGDGLGKALHGLEDVPKRAGDWASDVAGGSTGRAISGLVTLVTIGGIVYVVYEGARFVRLIR